MDEVTEVVIGLKMEPIRETKKTVLLSDGSLTHR